MAKGEKTCHNCKATVRGARTIKCPACGEVLIKGATLGEDGEAIVKTRTMFSYPDGYNIPSDGHLLRISIPSGECPIKLKPDEDGLNEEIIIDWADRVRQNMIDSGKYMNNEGLVYWVRRQLDKLPNIGRHEISMAVNAVRSLPDIKYSEVAV